MGICYKNRISHKEAVVGRGFINNLINSLPVELHLPGYQFCGPGTKLAERLARGEQGINPLDSACRAHDIAYSQSKDLKQRHIADKTLSERAWERTIAKDSSLSERANAWFVTNAMKTKVKFGMGATTMKKKIKNVKRRKPKAGKCIGKVFAKAVRSARKALHKNKPNSMNDAIEIARKNVKSTFRGINKFERKQSIPRIIPIPKVGGFLPLVPILTALGALGGIASGGSAIAKAINNAKSAREQLAEATRHNRYMESIAMGKGLYLKPYKKGYGLYLQPYPKNY